MSPADSLRVMRERSAKIDDVSGDGAITLTDPRGQSIRLDAAFVFAPPDRARVRAWKFGQAVLDLTVTSEGTWLYLPRQSDGRSDELRAASVHAGRAVREWLAALSGRFDSSAIETFESGPNLFITQPADSSGRGKFICRIDRRTLTQREVGFDKDGRKRFSLTLDRYLSIDDVVWPMRIDAESPSGLVRIDLRDVELNSAPEGAFTPPARAERLP